MQKDKKKRIAIVCFSRSLGGLELTSFRLAKSFSERNNVTFLLGLPDSQLSLRAETEQVPFIAIPQKSKYGNIHSLKLLNEIIRKYRIDLLLIMQSKDIFLAAFASVFHPSLTLVYYQQMDTRHNKRDFFHSWAYAKLSHWFTLTTMMKENVLFSTRMPESKISVLPLGTDLKRFNPAQFSKAEARTYFGIDKRKKIVGLLGRFDKGKGQHILLRAIPAIVKKFPNTLFVLAGEETAGENGFKKELHELCRTLAIEKYVLFLPFTEHVPKFMAALDLFIMPSFAETFGLVLIEAMAMGLPVIATNSGGVTDLVNHQQTGLLIEPGNVEQVSAAIQTILADAQLAQALGSEARRTALHRFDFEHCVDSLLSTLQTL